MYYEDTYVVCSRDTDPFNQCRPSAVLNFLQEAATRAAIDIHVAGWEMKEQYNCFWMLARLRYQLDKPIFWNDRLTVRTYHRGNKGAAMYRDFDLYRDGERIGEAVSTWVLADLENRKLLRLGQVAQLAGTTGGELCKSVTLHKVRLPKELRLAEERLLHYSDCDINGHVNNVRYADFACDAVHLEREGAGRFVDSLQISYLKECRPGEILALSSGLEDGVWYIRGTDGGGTERFTASLTLKTLS